MPLPLSPQVFSIIAHLIEERTGLHYEPASADLLADRVSDRATELGLDSMLDYYYFLRYDPGGAHELQVLAETLVVHETYFFREIAPLEVLVESIISEMLRTRPRIRIWSAACATGEEPYTLAMMLSKIDLLDRVEIVASDLSTRALAKAQTGVYAGRSLRSLPPFTATSGLLEETPTGMRVPDFLRRPITWTALNLIDDRAIRELGQFDVVLCRNVLIYFSEPTVAHVAANLGAALRPEGVLLVGASESLLRFGTLFACEERGGSFFYRKVGA
ncbi:MAG TPA: protein-glutamate O-methyltransferase CheR [Polyangiaceae bacterium]|jgi:chemotaxis protein methyltransferase CheR